MDSSDAKWYGDFLDTPCSNTASGSNTHTGSSVVPTSEATSSNNFPPSSTTRGSRVLCKMDSEQALDLYLQGNSIGSEGAEDTL